MGILEMISEFDPFLKSHIQIYGNAGVGTPSYLSSVLSEIIAEVKVTKYFSICIDSTPNITNIDQLTIHHKVYFTRGPRRRAILKISPYI